MKAIITGATGFLGGHLVEDLTAKGWEILALGRNSEKGKALENKHVTFKKANICLDEDLASIDTSADVIFHCAALSSPWGRYEDFYENNVIATEKLLSLAKKLNIKRFVHVSSPSIHFQYKDKFNYGEEVKRPTSFVNHYAHTKYLAELAVKAAASPSLETVIIRPRGIFGEHDETIMPRILNIAKKGFFPLVKQGRQLMDITYVKNVTEALFLAATVPNVSGQTYNITNGEPLPLWHILESVFNSMNINIRYIPIPRWLGNILGIIWEKLSFLRFGKEPRVTRYTINLLSYTHTLSIHKARQELGYQPPYSIKEGINHYAQWLKKINTY